MEDEAKRDLRSLRKAEVSLGIATHDVVDLFESQMGMLIINSCKTRFLLANAEAQSPEIAAVYRRLGCTETEVETIARMRPQGDYYLQQTYGQVPRRRPFSVPMSGLTLALCGSSSLADHHLMDRLLETHAPGLDFASAFLAAKAQQWRDAALAQTAKALRESVPQAAD
jgi:type IV secretion system protein VirB4